MKENPQDTHIVTVTAFAARYASIPQSVQTRRNVDFSHEFAPSGRRG